MLGVHRYRMCAKGQLFTSLIILSIVTSHLCIGTTVSTSAPTSAVPQTNSNGASQLQTETTFISTNQSEGLSSQPTTTRRNSVLSSITTLADFQNTTLVEPTTSYSTGCPASCQCFMPTSTLTHITCDEQNIENFPVFSLPEQAGVKTIISVSNNHITTIGKYALDGLTNVQTVQLVDNKISDMHPQWAGDQAGNIKHLHAAGNQLSDNAVISALSSLINLRELDLSRNELMSLGFLQQLNLSSLELLAIGNNRLPIIAVTPLSGLSNLQTLVLPGNRIEMINHDSFATIKRTLNHIDLSSNLLTDESLESLANCSVVNLYMDGNNFTSPFQYLEKANNSVLEKIVLSNNPLLTIPSIAFQEMSSLHTLQMENCGLARLDIPAEAVPASLRQLSLAHNQLTEIPSVLEYLTILEELDIRNNSISNVPKALKNESILTNLQYVDFSENLFGYPPRRFFLLHPNIRKVIMNHGQMYAIAAETFTNSPYLKYLDFSYNEIQTIDYWAFYGIPSYATVNLQHNRLVNLHQDILPSQSLGLTLMFQSNPFVCDCVGNWLTQLDGEIQAAECIYPPKPDNTTVWTILARDDWPCQTTTTVTTPLNDHEITTTHVRVSSTPRAISTESTSNNQQPTSDNIASSQHTTTLMTSGNPKFSSSSSTAASSMTLSSKQPSSTTLSNGASSLSTSIPSMSSTAHKTTTSLPLDCPAYCDCIRLTNDVIDINCDNQSLHSFPQFSMPPGNVIEISVSSGRLTLVTENALEGLSNVKTVKLVDNKITDIHPQWAGEQAGNIRQLNLAGNRLSENAVISALSSLTSLQELDLSRNQLVSFQFLQQLNLSQLQLLTISNNRLPITTVIRLSGLSNLHTLALAGNGIEQIEYGSFATIENTLSYMDLSSNMLSDESLASLENCPLVNLIINRNKLISPFQYLNNHSLLENIEISNNPLLTIPQWAFQGMSSLHNIMMENCGLSELDVVPEAAPQHLKNFSLAHNQLTEIPSVLQYLVDLQELNMRNNSISNIPKALKNESILVNLRHIDLSENQFNYPSKRFFFTHPNISKVMMNHGQMYAIGQETFDNSPNLEYLDFSHNEIQSIDYRAFYGISSSATINLQHNQLVILHQDILPEQSVGLTLMFQSNPFVCDCAGNWLTQLDGEIQAAECIHPPKPDNTTVWTILVKDDWPCETTTAVTTPVENHDAPTTHVRASSTSQALGSTSTVTTVAFSQRKTDLTISGNISTTTHIPSVTNTTNSPTTTTIFSVICPVACQCIRYTSTLIGIACDGRNLTYIPSFYMSQKSVIVMNMSISNNSIAVVGENVLDGLSNVQSVKLDDNEITDMHPKWAGDQALNLRELYLAGNKISNNAIMSALSALINLQKLDLSRNELTSLGFLQQVNLFQLELLVISNNKFPFTTVTPLTGLSNVHTLVLPGNGIEKIEGNSFETIANTLEYVNFSNNQLTDESLVSLTNSSIVNLFISKNKLNSPFQHLNETTAISVESIDISENPLTTISPFAFQRLSSLRALSMNKCGITQLNVAAEATPPALQILSIAHNQLTEVPNALEHLVQLEELDMRNNSILNIPTALKNESILVNLAHIDFSENLFNYPSKRFFLTHPNIRKIVMNHGQMYAIGSETFQNSPNLEYLDFSHNEIQSIDYRAFYGISSYATVNLQHNQLVILHQDILPTQPLGIVLKFQDNPFVCDCLGNWLTQLTGDVQAAECVYPPKPDNLQSWTILAKDDWPCQITTTSQLDPTTKTTTEADYTTTTTQSLTVSTATTQSGPMTRTTSKQALTTTKSGPMTTTTIQSDPMTGTTLQPDPPTTTTTRSDFPSTTITQLAPKTTTITQSDPMSTKSTESAPMTTSTIQPGPTTQTTPKPALTTIQSDLTTTTTTQSDPTTQTTTQSAHQTTTITQSDSTTKTITQSAPMTTTTSQSEPTITTTTQSDPTTQTTAQSAPLTTTTIQSDPTTPQTSTQSAPKTTTTTQSDPTTTTTTQSDPTTQTTTPSAPLTPTTIQPDSTTQTITQSAPTTTTTTQTDPTTTTATQSDPTSKTTTQSASMTTRTTQSIPTTTTTTELAPTTRTTNHSVPMTTSTTQSYPLTTTTNQSDPMSTTSTQSEGMTSKTTQSAPMNTTITQSNSTTTTTFAMETTKIVNEPKGGKDEISDNGGAALMVQKLWYLHYLLLLLLV